MNYKHHAFGVAVRNMLLNCLLAAAKLTVGTLAHSEALVSDGVHGAADILSAVVVMAGIRMSASRTDTHHPYGHERMECVAAVLLSVLVGATGLYLGLSGIQALMHPQTVGNPGWIALAVAIGSVVIKELMFRFTRRAAKRTHSAALMADAWHQRTDVFTSLGGLLGVGGACLGWPVLDPLAACVISLLIVRAAALIFADAMQKMTDRACDEATEQTILETAVAVAGVLSVPTLRTRLFGSRAFAEVTVCVDRTLSAGDAYEVMCAVGDAVEAKLPLVKECAVHIHPIAVANQAGAWYNTL